MNPPTRLSVEALNALADELPETVVLVRALPFSAAAHADVGLREYVRMVRILANCTLTVALKFAHGALPAPCAPHNAGDLRAALAALHKDAPMFFEMTLYPDGGPRADAPDREEPPTVPRVPSPADVAEDKAARVFADTIADQGHVGDEAPPKKRRGGPSGKTRPPTWASARDARMFLDTHLEHGLGSPRAAFEALAATLGVGVLAVVRVYAGDLPMPRAWRDRLEGSEAPAADSIGRPVPSTPGDP